MGRRTLSNAQVRQRLLALEKRMRELEFAQLKKEFDANEARWKAACDAWNANQAAWLKTQRSATELAASAMSAARISTPSQATGNAARGRALDRITLLSDYRESARKTWRLHAQVHDKGGALRRGWRRLQLRLASRLLGFGAHP